MIFNRKKRIYLILLVICLGLCYLCYFAIQYASIASAYAAKTLCSCIFVSKRDPKIAIQEDLYSVRMATTFVDTKEQSVTANVYGFAEAKAVFHQGLGCTLINNTEESQIRNQTLSIPNQTVANKELIKDSLLSNIDTSALHTIIREIFKEKDSLRILRTRAVVVLHKGQIIAEKYAENITPQTPLLGWSMTKSVTNAMIGLLVKDGKIDIYKSAPIKEWEGDERNKITTDHLLRMSSGLDFEEVYSKPSDATQMLFRQEGAGLYALQSNPKAVPDQMWYYSSGTTNILQEIIRKQFSSHADYLAYPHLRLFQKIGMTNVIMETDAHGTYIGSSFMYATARDWARFGQLYLQDGIWEGERILPEGWVKYSSQETPASQGKYAAQFWIEHQDKTFPQDAFMALGFEGQSITIIPSKQLVIVRLGCTPNEDDFNRNQFIKNILLTIK
jgi:CubicO group peptidase (beta-lactamase class C family)